MKEVSRPLASSPARKPRVLVIRAGMLGDTIWGTTPIESIRSVYGPDTEVDLIVKQGMGGLFRHDPRIGRVFEIKRRKLPLLLSPTKLKVWWRSLRQPYDLMLDLETSTHFRSLFGAARARKKVRGYSIRDQVGAQTEHAVVSLRKIIALALPRAIAERAAPSLVAPEHLDVRATFSLEGPYICVHCSNSWLAAGRTALRSWPVENWRDLLSQWHTLFPRHTPVLIGTSAEAGMIGQIAQDQPHCINLAGKTNLPQLMAVIAQSDAMISTDTGPSHMAAALGVPVVSLFGPTQPLQTGPFSDGRNAVKVLSVGLSCSPCVKTPAFDTCERNRCMESITPPMVATAVHQVLFPVPVAAAR
ncbi:glycosyltransferase family 9 protein [Pararobbsia silviterrae]|uniref:Glycosyltransferase family 9 protein n=1 Tax=Pararobbsia silviterrae TaxID=1792498 RepID=A0A494Y865_9BURK|nr:glycosyltransferase family 9 protein [Pararobbsia silviterrae]RKP56496.1 glycosyltransferase family 9 protein [Pararobbsia silviterrae]